MPHPPRGRSPVLETPPPADPLLQSTHKSGDAELIELIDRQGQLVASPKPAPHRQQGLAPVPVSCAMLAANGWPPAGHLRSESRLLNARYEPAT